MRPSLRSASSWAAAVGISAVLLATPAVAGGGDAPWPVAGRDPAHTSAAEGPAPPYAIAWEVELAAGPPIAGPVVGPDALYVSSRSAVTALDPASGDERWSAGRVRGSGGSPAIAGDRVVFVEGAGEHAGVAAVSADDGSLLWETRLDGAAPGGLTVSEGAAYLGTLAGTLYAIDLEDGAPLWTASVGPGEQGAAGEAIEGVPAVAGGRVYVTAQRGDDPTGGLYAFDAADGERAWAFRPDGNVVGRFSSPVVTGDLVVAGMGDGTVRALGVDGGRERWAARVRAPFGAIHMPALTDDSVLIADGFGHVYRLALDDGAERWVYRVPGLMVGGSISVSGDTVLAGDDDGQYSAIGLDDALLVWRREVGGRRANAVAVAPDRLYAASTSGAVLAFEHAPGGALLAEPSPTVLFAGRALLNYAGAFVLVLGGILGLFRLLPGRRD